MKNTNPAFFKKFISQSVEKDLEAFTQKKSAYWERVGQAMVLKNFHEMAARVPAYKDFLQKHNINSEVVKTFSDLNNIPPIDKKNYIDAYPLRALCWDNTLSHSSFLSTSSGSTGQPYFWPRSEEQMYQGALISEKLYAAYFHMDKKSTLYIVAFAMGTWIAGTYMMFATEWVTHKGYPVTVVTPGTNKDEILRLIDMGKNNYEQIVLVGYPPFIKDIVDSGAERGLKWGDIPIRFLFSGEAFTERWRDHLFSYTNSEKYLTDALNIYGSADVGLIAHETAVTIYTRRLAAQNPRLLKVLFHSERVPSVNQYDPRLRYFESYQNELLISARSGIPLLRYNTKDIGNVITFDQLNKTLKDEGIDIEKAFSERNIPQLLWKIPMVYLFGRGKFTAIIYGSNIYPEHVKLVVEHPKLVSKLTGKFVVSTEETQSHDQQLFFRVEMRPTVEGDESLAQVVQEIFVEEITKINSEYKNNIGFLGKKVYPKVLVHEYGDPAYFPRGIIKKLA